MSRVLIIEDEPQLLQTIVETLQMNHYDVVGVSNGFDGVEQARTHRPDIILCDIMMPEMDGFEVLKKIRSYPETHTLSFVFLTAKTDWASIRKGMEMGADDYLLKPFNAVQLMKSIEMRIDRIRKVGNQANQSLVETKEQLAYAIARDLSAPLKSMSSTVQHLTNTIDKLSTTEIQGLMESVSENTTQLNRMTEQITYFVQARSGLIARDKIKRSCRPEMLSILIESAINRARIFIHDNDLKPVQFDSKTALVEVFCFREVMLHALAEIITNAMLLSPDHGQVNIEANIGDAVVDIFVSYQGTANELTNQMLSLDEISKLDAQQLQQEGVGVGLALASFIIDAHNGKMTLQSRNSKHMTVCIRLPLAID